MTGPKQLPPLRRWTVTICTDVYTTYFLLIMLEFANRFENFQIDIVGNHNTFFCYTLYVPWEI